jgi:hypothetical protein
MKSTHFDQITEHPSACRRDGTSGNSRRDVPHCGHSPGGIEEGLATQHRGGHQLSSSPSLSLSLSPFLLSLSLPLSPALPLPLSPSLSLSLSPPLSLLKTPELLPRRPYKPQCHLRAKYKLSTEYTRGGLFAYWGAEARGLKQMYVIAELPSRAPSHSLQSIRLQQLQTQVPHSRQSTAAPRPRPCSRHQTAATGSTGRPPAASPEWQRQ